MCGGECKFIKILSAETGPSEYKYRSTWIMLDPREMSCEDVNWMKLAWNTSCNKLK
jgi:hypothetical protein